MADNDDNVWDAKLSGYNAAVASCQDDKACLHKAQDSFRDDVKERVAAGRLPTLSDCEDGWLVAECEDRVTGFTYEAYLPCNV